MLNGLPAEADFAGMHEKLGVSKTNDEQFLVWDGQKLIGPASGRLGVFEEVIYFSHLFSDTSRIFRTMGCDFPAMLDVFECSRYKAQLLERHSQL